MAKTNKLKSSEIAKSILQGRDSIVADLTPMERQYLLQTLGELKEGKQGLLDAIWRVDFDVKPVSVDEFLTNDHYMGQVGAGVYPIWRKELAYVLDPANEISEFILAGSIGIGKTTIAVLAMYYKIYWLLCMRSPQSFFNMIPGSPIIFGLFNVLKYLANDTSYKYLFSFLELSPYFSNACFGDKKLTKSIDFPHKIGIVMGSSALHALGQNLYGGVLDEANFGRKTRADSNEKGQVETLYIASKARVTSRFLQKGGLPPGFFCLCSSPRAEGDFLDKHIKKVATDPHTHIVDKAYWDVHQAKFEGSSKFRVLVGNRELSSRILDATDTPPPNMRVIEVPDEFRPKFEEDIESSIRDIAGVSTFGDSMLIHRPEQVHKCVAESTQRPHPFTRDTAILSIDDDVTLEGYIDTDKLLRLHDKRSNRHSPLHHPTMGRWIHVDLSKNRDATGIAMAGISDVVNVRRVDKAGQPYTTTAYKYWLDFSLRIRAATGSQIDFAKITNFIFYLRDCNFPILGVSYDSYGSVSSLQELYKGGFLVKTISVDKKVDPYYNLRAILVENRLDLYSYKFLIDEIIQLRDHSVSSERYSGPKIDHPKDGSKDCADAVCGALWALTTEKHTEAKPASPVDARAADHVFAAGDDLVVDTPKDTRTQALDALFED